MARFAKGRVGEPRPRFQNNLALAWPAVPDAGLHTLGRFAEFAGASIGRVLLVVALNNLLKIKGIFRGLLENSHLWIVVHDLLMSGCNRNRVLASCRPIQELRLPNKPRD